MRRPNDRARRGVAVGALAALVGWAAAAGATTTPASVGWSTYLRAGPGYAYPALSELEHDSRVEVVSCDARWCRVSDGGVRGYVDQDALRLPRTRAPAPPARTGCVVVGQADDRRPMPTRFCSARPAGD